MTKRLVFDMSDLINWQGNFSGIQRVVSELAYRYETEGAVFCYYLEAHQSFFAIDSYSQFMKDRAQAQVSGDSDTIHSNGTQKYFMKKIIRNVTPPGISKAANRIRRPDAGLVTAPTHEVFNFTPDDILLVFGGHWDKPHYTSTVRDIKEQFGIKVTHLINDLIPIYDRAHIAEVEHERFPKYIREIIELSDFIFHISVSTERDYKRFINEENIQNSPKTKVIYLGEDITEYKPTMPEGFKLDESFLLSVGTVEVRKNHALLYATYKLAFERGIELPKLVIVGRQGWLTGDIYYQMIHDSDVNDKFVFLHNVDDSELSWLYSNCLFVVFASHYEGWGLPVAEAAHYGKVAAVSNRSSIPEVMGEAAAYYSPYSSDECLNTIHSLLEIDTRKRYEGLVQQRKPITWDDTFNQAQDSITKYFI